MLACGAARRRLQAFHDRELAVGDQIAVGAHLDRCGACAAEYEELAALRRLLRAAAPGRLPLANDEAAVFASAVVSRQRAEEAVSAPARFRRMFDDMHLVYAGLGATAATMACLVATLGLLWFATDGRPDIDRAASLASVMNSLATPGTTSTPVDDEIRSRWTARLNQANEAAEQDAVFAMSVMLTRDGRLLPLQRLRKSGRDVALVESLMDEVARARLSPGVEGEQFGTSMVWLVMRTTVRGAARAQAPEAPLPVPTPAPKRLVPATRATRV